MLLRMDNAQQFTLHGVHVRRILLLSNNYNSQTHLITFWLNNKSNKKLHLGGKIKLNLHISILVTTFYFISI